MASLRIGEGQSLDGLASQALLEAVDRELKSLPPKVSPEARAGLFEHAAVYFDKVTDGRITKVSLKFSGPITRQVAKRILRDADKGDVDN